MPRNTRETKHRQNEDVGNLRIRVEPVLKSQFVEALEAQGVTQQTGVTRMIQFFLSFDRERRALILGQTNADSDQLSRLPRDFATAPN